MSEVLSAESPRVLEALKTRFGHGAYRVGQAELIDAILAGAPTLGVMPTGAGKSLCYQLPALVLGGVTLVVSPLIALIRDQVGALRAKGINAASLTSADAGEDRWAALRELKRGELQLLYVAPERFRSPSFLESLRGAPISLLAIDEAHCISTWGHDFRPDYARLGDVIGELRPPRVCALTATATQEVREDIARSLGLAGVRTIVTGFDRPNLELSVEEAGRGSEKLDAVEGALKRWLASARGRAIVYTATRRKTEEVAEAIAGRGWKAEAYHAGLSTERRDRVQRAFENDELDVVVATTAFGMGVDKSDVRVVVHHDIPSSPESYYQEVGRAGRDGLPAAGVLLYDSSDLRYAYMKLEASTPSADAVRRAFDRVRRISDRDGRVFGGFDELVEDLEADVGSSARAALIALERAGAVAIEPGGLAVLTDSPDIDQPSLERRSRVERAKLDAMIGYVQRASCRRRYLVDYFGDVHRAEQCGVCDRCQLPGPRALDADAATDVLKALSCVARMKGRWGKGMVADVLMGSKAKPVLERQLDQLSTYGLFAGWKKSDVYALFDSLARAGLVAVENGEYPKLLLTGAGADVLRSRGPVQLDLRLARWGDEVEEEGAPSAGGAGSGASGRVRSRKKRVEVERGALFEAFRSWRAEAASRAKMPPYVVAHDKLLEALAVLRPQSRAELASVPGIGPAKLDRYGDEILAIVHAHAASDRR